MTKAESEAGRLARAKGIYLAARAVPLARRDEFLLRECGTDQALRELVISLLHGDDLPLLVEALADGVRGAVLERPGITASLGSAGREGQDHEDTHIGPYKLLERLGEGGFGIVFMAEQEKPVRRRVALKIIKLGMDTRQVVARFEAERQALAMMDHPNIAKVFDAGATATGRPYFVMELVRGLPITEYCDKHQLPIVHRLELIAEVCSALHHAHQKGVIHRDIKPSNVLVGTVEGDKPLPKIIDFGIAKATSARLTEKTIFTEFRQMIGTPEYMSPEQTGESSEDVDTRTDVYSAGVLLYELLAGATPFDSHRLRSAAFGEMQRIIREEDPPRPSTRVTKMREGASSAIEVKPQGSEAGKSPRPLHVDEPHSAGNKLANDAATYPMRPSSQQIAAARRTEPGSLSKQLRGELDWIVMKAIEKDRARRYESASAMAADIQRYLTGHAVHAAPPDAWYRASKFIRRYRGPVIAGSLMAFALVAGLIGTSIGFFHAEAQRRVAFDEKVRADQQATEARSQRDRADQQTVQALASEARANRSAYTANMLSAWSALAANQFAAAREFLDAAPAGLRGWEWRTLSSRLDTSVRALPCPMHDWNPGEVAWSNDLIPHPDGRTFFTVRRFAVDAAQRWDLATGALIARYSRPLDAPPDIFSGSYFSISPDGTRLWSFSGAVLNVPVCAVSAWDLGTDTRVFHAKLPPIENADGVVAITPDGSRVLRNRGERLWAQDVGTGAVLATGDGYGFGGFRAISDDGALLAAEANGRGPVDIYDTRTLARVARLTGHKNVVRDIDFSHDNRWLASAAIEGTARIWDLSTTPPTSIILQHPNAVEGIRFSPDASLVVTMCRDLAIRVWDARTGDLRGKYSSGELLAGTVMFMPDGRTVAGRERDGTVRFWDVTAEATVNLNGHQGILNAAYFAPAAGLIVSAGWDGWKGVPGCVRMWDAQTGDEVASIGMPGEVAYRLAVSPDGTRAVASITKTDSPWTPKELIQQNRIEIIHLLTGHTTRVETRASAKNVSLPEASLSFDPSGALIAVGREERLEILDASDGSELRARESGFENKWFKFVSWSPDGRTIACAAGVYDGASSGALGGVEILDAQTLNTIRRLDCGRASSAVFSPDSSQLCVGSPEGLVRFFSTQTGELVRTLSAHEQGVNAIAFNPDGTRVATAGGDDGVIAVWNTETWDRVARHEEEDFIASLSWSDDGARLLGACGRTPRLWDDTPLRDRVETRDLRRQSLARIEALVAKLLEVHHSPTMVVNRISGDQSLSALDRRTALQILLRKGLEAQGAPSPTQPEPAVAPK